MTKSISAQEASNVLKVVAQGAASVLNLGSDWFNLDQVAADGLRVLKYCAGFSKKSDEIHVVHCTNTVAFARL